MTTQDKISILKAHINDMLLRKGFQSTYPVELLQFVLENTREKDVRNTVEVENIEEVKLIYFELTDDKPFDVVDKTISNNLPLFLTVIVKFPR